MADPTVDNSALTARYDIQDATGYTLSSTRLEDDHSSVSAASLGIVLQHTTTTADELDDSDFSNWQTNNGLTYDATVGRFGSGSAKAVYATAATSRLVLGGGLFTGNQEIVWFKLNGTTSTQDALISWANNPTGVPALLTGFGIKSSVANNHWSYFNASTTNWTDTNIVTNTDWNKLTFITGGAVQEEGGGGIFQLYLNDGLIYNDVNQSGQVRRIVINHSNGAVTFWVDRIWHRLNGALYATSGTAITPKLQPSKVYYWNSYAQQVRTDSPISGYQNTGVTAEVQYTADGGTNYGTNDPGYTNGLYIPLRTSNINDGFLGTGSGSDGMRMKHTLTSGVSGTSSPRLEQLDLTWLNERKKLYPFERFT